ncbi:MAG: UDP-N-acetylmuramoyl-L-alanine--D-glutamate ligase [Burkholderiales bacterium]|jgi:UDP-N-acetylmuramoylalanine--D-glutamate ligase|nr:UDP-N-acetylmuramoyl-L-alanine--D-glutamate ligase [Burkholderiales bacterium]
MFDLKGARVMVVGLGDTGLSMARWLQRRGAEVRATDSRAAPPHAATLRRELPQLPMALGVAPDVDGVDMIAVSPGVDRRAGAIAQAAARGVPVVGDVELFAQALAARNDATPVIAITGSNGKSTVTALAGEICKAAALRPVVAGNIGLPVLDAWTEIEDGAGKGVQRPGVFVLELSSFQLESTISLQARAATVLNLSEDHLDRYDGMREYAAAKSRIFAGDGVQVLNRQDRWSDGMAQSGRRVVRFGLDAPRDAEAWGIGGRGKESMLMRGDVALAPVAALRVAGLHNAANALAAGALCRAVGVADAVITQAWQTFDGLPHRVKNINKINNIQFYDDSKGTNVGATVAALNGMPQPVVLIAGGDGKGQDFAPLAAAAQHKARAVVLIGRDAERIADAIGNRVPLLRAADMEQAVELAFNAARAGDAVLLSPACASYDMYRNYIHRAEVFAAAVAALQRRCA